MQAFFFYRKWSINFLLQPLASTSSQFYSLTSSTSSTSAVVDFGVVFHNYIFNFCLDFDARRVFVLTVVAKLGQLGDEACWAAKSLHLIKYSKF